MKHNLLKKLFVLISLFLIMLNTYLLAQQKERFEYQDNIRVNTRTNVVAAMYDINSPVYQGTPEEIARQFLNENKTTFGISNISDLKLIEQIKSPAGKHVGFIQTVNGMSLLSL